VDIAVKFADEEGQQTLTAREFFESAELQDVFESKEDAIKLATRAMKNRVEEAAKAFPNAKELEVIKDDAVQTKKLAGDTPVAETLAPPPLPLSPPGQHHPPVPSPSAPSELQEPNLPKETEEERKGKRRVQSQRSRGTRKQERQLQTTNLAKVADAVKKDAAGPLRRSTRKKSHSMKSIPVEVEEEDEDEEDEEEEQEEQEQKQEDRVKPRARGGKRSGACLMPSFYFVFFISTFKANTKNKSQWLTLYQRIKYLTKSTNEKPALQ